MTITPDQAKTLLDGATDGPMCYDGLVNIYQIGGSMNDSPQQRRLQRLTNSGLHQRNLLVHQDNQESFETLRPSFADPTMKDTLASFADSFGSRKLTNVSQVRQLSPFRYPGGKTWLIPVVREWFQSFENTPKLLVESFAGGAIVGLTAAAEGWSEHVRLVELDDDVAAVWNLVIYGSEKDFNKFTTGIIDMDFNIDTVRKIIDTPTRSISKRALRTIVKNRAQRGGIMAPGAGLMKGGENGKGVSSRWYPETLVNRFNAIRAIRERLTFVQGDAITEIEQHQGSDSVHFVDPPYTAGGKKAGSRLYTHNEVDHDRLFEAVEGASGAAMLTYDDNTWVRERANKAGFVLATSAMQSTHLVRMHELVILKEQS